jgi:hypothetical protein
MIYLDFEKLRRAGFTIEPDDNGVAIFGRSFTEENLETGRAFAKTLGLNPMEMDMLFDMASELSMWSGLRANSSSDFPPPKSFGAKPVSKSFGVKTAK